MLGFGEANPTGKSSFTIGGNILQRIPVCPVQGVYTAFSRIFSKILKGETNPNAVWGTDASNRWREAEGRAVFRLAERPPDLTAPPPEQLGFLRNPLLKLPFFLSAGKHA